MSSLMGRLTAYLTIILVLSPSTASGSKLFHQYVQNRWSIEEGLLQVTANTMVQDADGYIWIGSQVGLSRFDGVKFTTYSSQNTPALSGLINQLYIDSKQRLWIGASLGLGLYQNNEFTSIPFGTPELKRKFPNISIRAVIEIAQDRIIVSSNNGLFEIIDGQLYRFEDFDIKDPHALLANEFGFWVGGVGEIIQFNNKSKTVHSLGNNHKEVKVNHMVSYQDQIWAGTSKGLYRISDGNSDLFKGHPMLSSLPIDAIMRDSNNELWVGTTQGLFRIIEGKLFEFIDNNNRSAFKVIRSMLEDHEGNIWLGSYIHGIARLYKGSTYNYGVESGLSDPLVWSVQPDLQDPDVLWVGTNNGLDILHNGKFSSVLKGDQLPNPVAYTMLVEQDQLWIGTRGGIALYKDQKIATPESLSMLNKNHFRSIIKDKETGYFFGTDAGLFHYNNDKLKHYAFDKDGHSLIVWYLVYSNDGTLLIGCEDGLYQLENDQVSKVFPDNTSTKKFDVSFILENSDRSLLLGTNTKGLLYMKEGKTLSFRTDNVGIPTPGAFFITNDNNGVVWVSSFNGLYRFPYKNIDNYISGINTSLNTEMLLDDTGRVYGAQKSNCCTGAGLAKGIFSNNWLTLPSRTGVIRINTEKIETNLVAPNANIERFFYADSWHAINDEQVFVLENTERDIAFEFTLLSYQQPKNILIEYQLEGYDKEWKKLPDITNRNVTYTNLPSGSYSFKVRGANNSKVWSIKNAIVNFEIKPYFYETIWFYLIAVLGLVSLFYFWHHRRLAVLNAQRKLLEIEVSKRTEELSVANQKLLDVSLTDPLTGLKNRRYLESQLPKDISFLERNLRNNPESDESMVFMMVDIDHFKSVNDDYGHTFGDQVIVKMAELFTDVLRAHDYIVRWGGEEFLIVMRTRARSEAVAIANRLSANVADVDYSDILKGRKRVTCSIGFSCFPITTNNELASRFSQSEYIKLADKALYQVKENGRNGWATYSPLKRIEINNLDKNQSLESLIKQLDVPLTSSW
jgi:diguanylate cyclase (GGDEF)-like protein